MDIGRYEQLRENPVIEAVLVTAENLYEVAGWCDGTCDGEVVTAVGTAGFGTQEIRAHVGQMLARRPDGYFYVRSAADFDAHHRRIVSL